MRIRFARVLLAFMLALGLTAALAPTPARAEVTTPAAEQVTTEDCFGWTTTQECAYFLAMEAIRNFNEYTGACDWKGGLAHICDDVVAAEKRFWRYINTWEAAQDALLGYEQAYEVHRLRTDLWKTTSEGLLNTARARVDALFDSETHAYIGPLYFSKTNAPTMSGTVQVDKTLTAKVNAWSPAAGFRFQWYRNGKAIAGATKSSYKLIGADYGMRLIVKVFGSRAGYESEARTSSPTAQAKAGVLSKGKVKVTGSSKVKKTLTAKTYGTWSTGVVFTYKWYRNGKTIKGATTVSYKLTKADRGKRIKVKVTARKQGYTSTSRTSKYTKKVRR